MTSHDPISPTDEALRWQLRALRQDMPPTRDLWPGIAARLATSPRHQAPVSPRRPWTPFALAASVLLAVTVTWQLQQAPTGDPLIQREAAALTRDYAGALAQLDRQVAAPPEIALALRDPPRHRHRAQCALPAGPVAPNLRPSPGIDPARGHDLRSSPCVPPSFPCF